MNTENTFNKVIATILIYSHFLVGCVANNPGSGNVKPGPKPSSSYESESKNATAVTAIKTNTKLDVVIPVFDPGLSEKAENYEEEGVWPELRRAEANRFAYKLKQALDKTGAFGAVRVTPDTQTTGDLYLIGKIKESDGEDVEIQLSAVDITGKQWLDKSFSHTVKEGFYKDIRKKGQDAYDPLFEDAANAVIEELKDKENTELTEIKQISKLRFGASFNAEAFNEYMVQERGFYKVASLPSDNDPMVERVNAIQIREQLFVDNLQQNYAAFSSNMEDSYLKWQEASYTENKLRSEAKTKGVLKALGGALLLGLSIAAAVSGDGSSNVDVGSVATSTAVVAGGIAGAWMLSSSFQSFEEAKFHKEAIDELGESVNMEMAPQVVSFEEETVELTGNVKEQYEQWRAFLQRIYEQEATPTTQL